MKLARKVYYLIILIGYYIGRLVAANLFIAMDILSPRLRINPGIIEVQTGSKKNTALLLLSNLISMTPGTLSTDIDPSKEKLIIHLLYLDQKEQTLKEIEKLKELIVLITG